MIPVLAAEGNPLGFWLATGVLPAAVMLATLPAALLASARFRGILRPVLERSTAYPLRCFAVGLLGAVSTLVLLAASKSGWVFGVAGVFALAAVGCFAFVGLVAESRRLGCDLRGADPAGEAVEGGALAVGWLVHAGLPLLFGVGPLVLLYLALRSLGATVVALATRE